MRYKVGDRVKYIEYGDMGEVQALDREQEQYLVFFNNECWKSVKEDEITPYLILVK